MHTAFVTSRASAGKGNSWVHSTVDRLGVLTVAIFVIVVAAAGISGLVLLLAPGSTGRYFSWTLRPRAAAAVIGGLYVASAIVFAWALTASRRQARPLVVGILGLAVPTLVLTIVYDEVFDFSRWQAVLWVVLFVSAPVSAAAILATTAADDPGAARLRPKGDSGEEAGFGRLLGQLRH